MATPGHAQVEAEGLERERAQPAQRSAEPEKRLMIGVWLSKSQHEAFRRAAQKQERSMAALARLALRPIWEPELLPPSPDSRQGNFDFDPEAD